VAIKLNEKNDGEQLKVSLMGKLAKEDLLTGVLARANRTKGTFHREWEGEAKS